MANQPADGGVTDERLVEQAKSGDLAAFEELVRRHQHRLYNFVFRMSGNSAVAEELTQAALVRAWKALAGFRGRSSFKTWLYRIATNLVMNYRTRTRPVEELTEAIPAPESVQPEAEYRRHQQEREVRAALAKLPSDQRLALVLSAYEGQSYRQIATVMGRSVRAVDSLLFRAKQNLRRLLQPARQRGIV